MKFRSDFVTNSSSSSYVCEICGESGSGWDASPEDFDMTQCVNGHVICKEHMLTPSRDQLKEELLQFKKWDYKNNCEVQSFTPEEIDEMSVDDMIDVIMEDYEIPEYMCPICQFEEYSENDMAQYLLKEYKVPRDEVFAEIKKTNKRRRKLYDHEYIAYVVSKFGLNLGEIQASWKEKYKTYAEFIDRLRSQKDM